MITESGYKSLLLYAIIILYYVRNVLEKLKLRKNSYLVPFRN